MYHIFADNNLIYQPENPKLRLINPKLTVEMGKAGSLEFGLPPTHEHYRNLQQLKTLLTVYMDNEELFRGRVFSNKRNFNNVRDIYGEGNLSYLVDSVQMAEKYTGKSHALFRKIIAAHNAMVKDSWKQFEVGNITVDDVDVFLAGQSEEIEDQETGKFNYKQIAINSITDNWQTSFDYIESCLIDYEGGYLRTRYDATTGKTYIDWLKDYYGTASQTIEFGKNMLDLTEESSPEELFTVLIPLGDENLTIEKVNNGSKELVDADLVAKYGRIVKTNIFDNVTDPQTLLENGRRYLANNAAMEVTITITAVDLHLINPSIRSIYLGDKVHVLSPGHELDDRDLVCTKIEYDLANPANTVYTFGKPKQTLTERYRKDKKAQDAQSGRSGGGGGGGAGNAGSEESELMLVDWFRSFFNYDPDKATLDMGTIFTRLKEKGAYPEGENDPNVLKWSTTKLQFNSDEKGSIIDLKSYTRSKEEIIDGIARDLKNTAGIDIKSTDQSAWLDLTATSKDVKGNTETVAAFKLWAGYDPKKGFAYSLADLSADIVNIRAKTLSLDSELIKINSKVIDLGDDLTTIKGNISFSDRVTFSKYIDVPGVYANYLFRGNMEVALHTHSLSCSSTGKVTIGTVNKWGDGVTNSFNIADTKYFKDAVSAAGAASLSTSQEYLTNPKNGYKYYQITVAAKNQAGEILKQKTFQTNYKAYTDGMKNVSVSSVEYRTHTSSTCSFRIILSNGNSYNRTVSW